MVNDISKFRSGIRLRPRVYSGEDAQTLSSVGFKRDAISMRKHTTSNWFHKQKYNRNANHNNRDRNANSHSNKRPTWPARKWSANCTCLTWWRGAARVSRWEHNCNLTLCSIINDS